MTRLHHIGYLVADLGTGAQAFAQRFGYRVASEVFTDPRQTAKVQFLMLGGATPWLELVTPDGPKSRLGGALNGGQTLHHLCYQAEDFEGHCAHLRECGMLCVLAPQPAVAFDGARVAWFMDRQRSLVEVLETGNSALHLPAGSPAQP